MINILKVLVKIYDFITAFAYVVTKFDEWVEQCKTFWKWLTDDDSEESEKKEKS